MTKRPHSPICSLTGLAGASRCEAMLPSLPCFQGVPAEAPPKRFEIAPASATVQTHQRRIITKLRNNPAATEVEDLTFDGTAVFEIPAELISVRSGDARPAQAQAATTNLGRVRRSGRAQSGNWKPTFAICE